MKTNHPNKLTTVAAIDGQFVSVVGDTYRVVITGRETGGAFAVVDMFVPPGGGPGPHSHAGFQESFHVLDGQIEVKTETGNFTATKGSFINIPLGGLIHSFKNTSRQVAHLWCVVVPAGLEEFFLELGEPVQAGKFLAPPTATLREQQRIKTLAEKFGQKLFPPDYFG